MNKIKLAGLKQMRGGKTVLKRLNLSLDAPAIVGLVGPNGAGKTTLLQLLTGQLRASEGELHVFGEVPFDNLFVSANSIFIHDRMQIPDTLSLGEVLAEMAHFYPNWDGQLANNLMAYFELSQKDHHKNLSKGSQSVFNMIIGLSAYTLLTVFDEPMTGMDESTRKDVYRALLKNYLEFPRLIILSSHHLNEIDFLLEKLLLLKEGQVIFDGDMDDFRDYAIGLTGASAVLMKWAQSKEVIYSEPIGLDDAYVVLKNNVPQKELELFSQTQSRVEASDLAVYLTKKQKGVVDHVFRGSKLDSSE